MGDTLWKHITHEKKRFTQVWMYFIYALKVWHMRCAADDRLSQITRTKILIYDGRSFERGLRALKCQSRVERTRASKLMTAFGGEMACGSKSYILPCITSQNDQYNTHYILNLVCFPRASQPHLYKVGWSKGVLKHNKMWYTIIVAGGADCSLGCGNSMRDLYERRRDRPRTHLNWSRTTLDQRARAHNGGISQIDLRAPIIETLLYYVCMLCVCVCGSYGCAHTHTHLNRPRVERYIWLRSILWQ